MNHSLHQRWHNFLVGLCLTLCPHVSAQVEGLANWGTYAQSSTLNCMSADCSGSGVSGGDAGAGLLGDGFESLQAASVVNDSLGSTGISAGFIPLGPWLQNMFFAGNSMSTALGISQGSAQALGLYSYTGPDTELTITLSMAASFSGPTSGAHNDIDGVRARLLVFSDPLSILQISDEQGANLLCLFKCYSPDESISVELDSGISTLSSSVTINLIDGDQFYLYGQANLGAAGGGAARIINKVDIDFSVIDGLSSVPIGVGQLDFDNDGVADHDDNCLLVANTDQRDTNNDGYGNICDPDINNDGTVNFLDFSEWAVVFNTMVSGDEDFNGDDVANFLDLAILSEFFLMSPGPSGFVP